MLPWPCTWKPLPMKATCACIASSGGQSRWNRMYPSRMSAVASKRPSCCRNGQSSRSPDTSPRPPVTVPPSSAMSSQATAASDILWWIQNFFAAGTGVSSICAAIPIHGRVPSPWNHSPPRRSAA